MFGFHFKLSWKFKFWLPQASTLLALLYSYPIAAQITSDGVLNSTVTPPNQNKIIQIDGGTTSSDGVNLFHGFKEFSVPNGYTAYFNNVAEIQNIFSRVTGSKISIIEGIIKANGTANLFLINPNGIIFGSNASLDINGSFLATTADSVIFENGSEFSVRNNQIQPLLRVSVPVGLQWRSQARDINVQDSTLKVDLGKTLSLFGGNINMNYGQLIAPGGRVELGGLSTPGIIALNQDGSSRFPESATRADVTLRNESLVDVSANNGGNIAIVARNLEILGESVILAGIAEGEGSLNSQAGEININAKEIVTLDESSGIANTVETDSIGNGGNINITTGSLFVTNGAGINTYTNGQGDAGSITINARDIVSFDGVEGSNSSSATSSVSQLNSKQAEGQGKGGNINITTNSLFITNGAGLSSSTAGVGDAGDVKVIARDKVVLDGVGTNEFPSNISSTVGVIFPESLNGQGNGGDIDITTGSLEVKNGAFLAAGSVLGKGEAGNIIINAREKVVFDGVSRNGTPSAVITILGRDIKGKAGSIDIKVSNGSFFVTNGAVVSTFTAGQGEAGNIRINAARSVELSGLNFEEISGHLPANSLFIERLEKISGFNPIEISTGLYTSTQRNAQGRGGTITVQTPILRLTKGAIINAQTSNANPGGNIDLSVEDLLLLQGNSRISARADLAGTGGDSGNVNIDAKFIVAYPNENNDITANAVEGRGGNIAIQSQGIFGLQQREAASDNNTNDIDASSRLGISGTVNITNPEVDPTAGAIELISTPINADALIAQDVCKIEDGKIAGGSSFVVTGRGGLPPSADDPLVNSHRIVEWATRSRSVSTGQSQQSRNSSVVVLGDRHNTSRPAPRRIRAIEQAQGWKIASDGTLMLTAQAHTPTSLNPSLTHPECRAN